MAAVREGRDAFDDMGPIADLNTVLHPARLGIGVIVSAWAVGAFVIGTLLLVAGRRAVIRLASQDSVS